jgi:hypothetical protein
VDVLDVDNVGGATRDDLVEAGVHLGSVIVQNAERDSPEQSPDEVPGRIARITADNLYVTAYTAEGGEGVCRIARCSEREESDVVLGRERLEKVVGTDSPAIGGRVR